MRVPAELTIDPAKDWQRLQDCKEWFLDDLEQLQRDHHRRFLEELMRHERQCFLNVAPYQRHVERTDQANGFYARQLTTRLGVLTLAVPRTRSGLFHPQVLPRYQRREPAVDAAIREVFLLGVSTRQTGRALATLVEDAVSAATVSAVSKALDAAVGAWHQRPLTDQFMYLILDAVSVRIRLVGKTLRRQALCAYGVRAEGPRELIDFLIVKSESEESWHGFLQELWRRGLRGQNLRLITTDGHAGLEAAVHQVWPRVAHQRCWVHKLRNLENKLKRSQRECLEQAKLIYQAAHRREAVARFRVWKARWRGVAAKAVACVEQDLEELLAFYDCPAAHRKLVRSTNVIERLFVEVRRRIRTMCAFTTRDSCERILFSVFYRMNQHWTRHPLKTFTQNT
jgi:transposase-like protein